MILKENNNTVIHKIDSALGFIWCIDHAMQKTEDYENAMHQLKYIGYSKETVKTIELALDLYRKSILDKLKK